MIIRLYDKTPLHRDNFIKLVNEHFFDSFYFTGLYKRFMIQGGDPQSKNAQPGQMLGMGDVGYTIPAEFDTSLFHKKGALAAARTPIESCKSQQRLPVLYCAWPNMDQMRN